MKKLVKSILKSLRIDLTRNMQYDRQTLAVFDKALKIDSGCIDIGCHKGEILTEFIKRSPNGTHFAYEPIPIFFSELKKNFTDPKIHLFPYALAEKSGHATFNHVKNAPAYSGLKERKYAIQNPEIEKIDVEIKTLDETIPADQKIDLIKIDVEGAEYGVLKGGIMTIKRNKPVIVFEFGMGASDFYGTKPTDIFQLITNETELKISTMKRWLKKQKEFSLAEFEEAYKTGNDYYFIAYP